MTTPTPTLVERLRAMQSPRRFDASLTREAAARIERLEGALREIAFTVGGSETDGALKFIDGIQKTARKALEGK